MWESAQKTFDLCDGFVVQTNGMVLPLEAKAAENLQAKSLKSYYSRYSPGKAFRTSLSGYRKEEWISGRRYMNRESLRSIDIKLSEETEQLIEIEGIVPECVGDHTPH